MMASKVTALSVRPATCSAEVEQDDAARHKRQRQRHVEHRPPAGCDARLGQGLDVVGDRLDARIGAAAQRIGAQQQTGHGDPAELAGELPRLRKRRRQERRHAVDVGEDPVDDEETVGDHEADENRQQHADRLLHAAQVEIEQKQNEDDLEPELQLTVGPGQEREQCVDAARHRDRDGEDVVDDEGAAGDKARGGPEQAAGDLVAAPAVREQLDDLVVGEGDHEHGDCRQRRQVEPERSVRAERKERLRRPVAGRRQAVGAEPDPGKESDERDVLARLAAEGVERLAEDLVAYLGPTHHGAIAAPAWLPWVEGG